MILFLKKLCNQAPAMWMHRMSAPHPEKKQKKRRGTHKKRKIHANKWQLSDSDSTINDPEDSRRTGNKRVKW